MLNLSILKTNLHFKFKCAEYVNTNVSLHWLPACAAVQQPVFARHSWSSGTGSEDDPTPAKLSATSEEPVLSPKDT